jgi:hypothetical protein
MSIRHSCPDPVAFDKPFNISAADPDEGSVLLGGRKLSSLNEAANRVLAEAAEVRSSAKVDPVATVASQDVGARRPAKSR